SPLRSTSLPETDEQDNLYHVAVQGLEHNEVVSQVRLISSVAAKVNPYKSFDAFLAAGENRKLEFVFSNSTEAGIVFNPLDADPAIPGESFPAKVTQLLYHRFRHFAGSLSKGLIFIPCELIDNNGDTLQSVVLQYCQHWSLPVPFVQWIKEANIFCNSMVDRIVTGYPKDNAAEINLRTGFNDKKLVAAEPYHLWVIEGEQKLNTLFPAQKAGLAVRFVRSIQPYRLQKVRILNGAHTLMVGIASLRGLKTVKESIDHKDIGHFIRRTITEEIIPTLSLPVDELFAFTAEVMDRFGNPYIRHELSSIALNSVSKFKVRVLPTLLDYLKAKSSLPPGLIQGFAAMILFYKGEWDGRKMPVNDSPEIMHFFETTWESSNIENVVTKTLSNKSLWDQDLTLIEGMEKAVTHSLQMLMKNNA
ncbi:MAG TPA: tagaturonate reductase, partial [Chryseolinea sp.]|nr:tagaturonate reductase [Chryseolinea sp.]